MNKKGLFLSAVMIIGLAAGSLTAHGGCGSSCGGSAQSTPGTGLSWFLPIDSVHGALLVAFLVGPIQHFINDKGSAFLDKLFASREPKKHKDCNHDHSSEE